MENTKIWKEILGKDGFSVAPDKAIDDIIRELFIPHEIDPKKFITNYEALSRRDSPSLKAFWHVDEDKPTTPSITYFINGLRYAPVFPPWFYGAYPDVMMWFCEWQLQYARAHKLDNDFEDVMADETAKLFGINLEDKSIDENQIIDSDGKYRPTSLKNLVTSYRKKTNNKLETGK